MKLFLDVQGREALKYADSGNQALHVFVTVARGGRRVIAHLMDRDARRLEESARRFGVDAVKVERAGEREQRVPLLGAPLWKALGECER